MTYTNDATIIGDGTTSPAAIQAWFVGLQRLDLFMQPCVFTARHYLQVRRMIITSVLINVMHDLVRLQWASNHSCRNKTVLIDTTFTVRVIDKHITHCAAAEAKVVRWTFLAISSVATCFRAIACLRYTRGLDAVLIATLFTGYRYQSRLVTRWRGGFPVGNTCTAVGTELRSEPSRRNYLKRNPTVFTGACSARGILSGHWKLLSSGAMPPAVSAARGLSCASILPFSWEMRAA